MGKINDDSEKTPLSVIFFVVLNCAFAFLFVVVIASLVLSLQTLLQSEPEDQIISVAIGILAIAGALLSITNARRQTKPLGKVLIAMNIVFLCVWVGLSLFDQHDRVIWSFLALLWFTNLVWIFHLNRQHSTIDAFEPPPRSP